MTFQLNRQPSKHNQLLRQSAVYLLARGLPGIINLLVIILYTRLLSPDDYGLYALIIAIVGLTNSVIFQWLRLGLLRYLPVYLDKTDLLLSIVLKIFLWLVLITGAVALMVLPFFWSNSVWRGLIFMTLFLLWGQGWFELNLELVRVKLKPFRYGIISMFKAVIALGLGTVLIYFDLAAYGALLGLVVGLFLSATLFGRQEWRGVRFFLAESGLNHKLFRYGMPLSATAVLTMLVHNSDRYLIAWLIDTNAVGLYAAGYDLAQQGLGVIMSIVALAGYPLVVRALEQKGFEAAQHQLRQYALLFLVIAVPAAIGLAVLAPNIAGVFLGKTFQKSAIALIPPVALAIFISGVKSYYLDFSFQLGRHTIGQVWVMLAAALVNITLNLWWIPNIGIIGAAYATVTAYGMGFILSLIYGRRFFRLPMWPSGSSRVFYASIVMSGVLWLTRPFHGGAVLVGQVTLGCLVYGLSIVIFNVGKTRHRICQYLSSTP